MADLGIDRGARLRVMFRKSDISLEEQIKVDKSNMESEKAESVEFQQRVAERKEKANEDYSKLEAAKIREAKENEAAQERREKEQLKRLVQLKKQEKAQLEEKQKQHIEREKAEREALKRRQIEEQEKRRINSNNNQPSNIQPAKKRDIPSSILNEEPAKKLRPTVDVPRDIKVYSPESNFDINQCIIVHCLLIIVIDALDELGDDFYEMGKGDVVSSIKSNNAKKRDNAMFKTRKLRNMERLRRISKYKVIVMRYLIVLGLL